MKENSRIDNLFKTKVPQKEQVPPEDVWENIASRLSEPQRVRYLIIPLWFKLAGVAAVIILFVTLFNYSGRPSINTPAITDLPAEEAINQNEIVVGEGPIKASSKSEEKTNFQIQNAMTGTNSKRPKENKAEFLTPAEEKIKKPLKIKPFEITSNPRKEEQNIYSLSAETLKSSHLVTQEKNAGNLPLEYDEKSREPIVSEIPLKDRFSVSPTIAAIYSGKIGNGNALDNDLSNYSNPGSLSMVYGISLAYQISKKTKIRSGINNISLSSTTRQVDNATAINSVAFEGNPLANTYIPEGTGDLNHHLRFIEMPVELEHTLVNNKFGINLIAGASTYFLQKNEVDLNSAVISTHLGPANNINETSLSANLGLGFTYRFNSRFHFNLDPIIKYQINTYENVSHYKPYFLGVYSGFQFKL